MYFKDNASFANVDGRLGHEVLDHGQVFGLLSLVEPTFQWDLNLFQTWIWYVVDLVQPRVSNVNCSITQDQCDQIWRNFATLAKF